MQFFKFTLLSSLLLVLISCGQEETKNKEVSAPKKIVTVETTAAKEVPPESNNINDEQKIKKVIKEITGCNWLTVEQVIAKRKKINDKREKTGRLENPREACDASYGKNDAETISKGELEYQLNNQIKNANDRFLRNEAKYDKQRVLDKIVELKELKKTEQSTLNKINKGQFKIIYIEKYPDFQEDMFGYIRDYYFVDDDNLFNVTFGCGCESDEENEGDLSIYVQKITQVDRNYQ